VLEGPTFQERLASNGAAMESNREMNAVDPPL